jgi:Flp pilus assembly protein TadG
VSRPGLRHRFLRHTGGATAVEYALVLPLVVTMILGSIWAGLLAFSVSSMELAVESAARCAAVDGNRCPDAQATQVYALSQYAGPAISPSFTLTNTGCGHTVTGRANFNINILPGVSTMPINVTACYP